MCFFFRKKEYQKIKHKNQSKQNNVCALDCCHLWKPDRLVPVPINKV